MNGNPWKYVPGTPPNCGAIVDTVTGFVICANGWAGDDGWCSAPRLDEMQRIVAAVNELDTQKARVGELERALGDALTYIRECHHRGLVPNVDGDGFREAEDALSGGGHAHRRTR